MRKLQVLQNSSLRLLLRAKYETHTSSLLEQSKSLSVNQTVVMNMLTQVWKIKKCHQPMYHYERLFGNKTVNFNLSQGRGSFFYLWNHLPPGIRLAQSKEIFRTSVKSWIMDQSIVL